MGDQIFLKAGQTLDYSTQPSYSVRVKTTDAGGEAVESVLVLTVDNVAEIGQVVIGDGTVQRSRIQGVSVAFDGPVILKRSV